MQPPVARAGDDRFAGQLGAMEEEQQSDGEVGDPVEDGGHLALGGQQAGDRNDGDQRKGEIVR
ncbi:hypothetical protein D3C78_1394990 [compost metagenome]